MYRMLFVSVSLVIAVSGSALSQESKPVNQEPADQKTTTTTTETPPTFKGGYDKGFFLNIDKIFEIKMNARIQARYAFGSVDNGEDKDRTDSSAFSIASARLMFKGNALIEGLSYQSELEIGGGNLRLYDCYINYSWIPKVLEMRVGQGKRPFARQYIQSSGKYEMVTGSLAVSSFSTGYDIGINFHDGYEKSPPFEWAVSLYNGDTTGSSADKPWYVSKPEFDQEGGLSKITTSPPTNVPAKFRPTLVVRAGYNSSDKVEGYSEGDLEGGPLRLAVAASALVNFDYDEGHDAGVMATLDYVLKVQHLSLSGAFFVAMEQKKWSEEDQTGFADQEYKRSGAYIQAGYAFAGKYQPVVRYSLVSTDKQKTAQELALGFSVYFAKHNFKWQTYFGAISNSNALKGKSEGYDHLDYQGMTQLLFQF